MSAISKLNRRHGFHGVSGSGGRGDGARGRFRHGQAERSDDRHDNRSRAISRQTADRMLVDHEVDFHDNLSESKNFPVVQWPGGARRDEGCEVNIGVLAVDHIGDDGSQVCFAQLFAVDAAAHLTQGVDGIGVAGADHLAILQTKSQPGRLGVRCFVKGDEFGRYLVQRCLTWRSPARSRTRLCAVKPSDRQTKQSLCMNTTASYWCRCRCGGLAGDAPRLARPSGCRWRA